MEGDSKLLIILIIVIILAMIIYGFVFFGSGIGMFTWIGSLFSSAASATGKKLGVLKTEEAVPVTANEPTGVPQPEVLPSTPEVLPQTSSFKQPKKSKFSGSYKQFL